MEGSHLFAKLNPSGNFFLDRQYRPGSVLLYVSEFPIVQHNVHYDEIQYREVAQTISVIKITGQGMEMKKKIYKKLGDILQLPLSQ